MLTLEIRSSAYEKTAQRFDIHVVGKRRGPFEIAMNGGNCGAHIANLVRERADGNSRTFKKLMQTRNLVHAQVLGDVKDHGGQADPSGGAICGEADIREKRLAILAQSTRLHDRAKQLHGGVVYSDVSKRG